MFDISLENMNPLYTFHLSFKDEYKIHNWNLILKAFIN